MQPLFFQPLVYKEKIAAETQMPEDPNQWPAELMQELFRQVPYVSDFDPHVTMDRVDAEKGYGLGHVEVQNKTQAPQGTDEAGMAAAGVKSVRIPVIIKDRKLQPLDLIVNGESEVLPLTEARLRAAIFRPQAFDVTGKGPGDMSMIGQLYPPYRQNFGGGTGGGMTMDAGAMGKMGAASLLEAILPTINESDYNAFFQKVADDRGLQAQLGTNSACVGALKCLASYEPAGARKLASAALEAIKPSVVQLRKEVEGYSLKTASHACWLPKTAHMNRGEAVRLLGAKVVLAADETGSATMALGEGVQEEQQNPEADKPALITQFGIYKVQNKEGQELIGYVFPNLIDIDGKALPIALFTNGSQKAVQGDIVGIGVGGGASLFEGPPRGTGCFYQMLSNGRAQALVPMKLGGSTTMPDQGATTLHGETYDGTPVQVSVQPNIQECTLVDGTLLVPDSFAWMPLDAAEDTQLVEVPEGWNAPQAAKEAFATVQLRHGGEGTFSVQGFPVEKLANEEKQFLNLDETLFLLGGLGADFAYAQTKIGEAAAWSRPVSVRVGRYIKTAGSVMSEAKTKAASTVGLFDNILPKLRKDLVKEAAVITDPTAVDTVLSLGFLNPENLGTFIGYLPVLDDAQKKLCELLLASRLGLPQIAAGALEKAVRSTEEAIEGLRILAFQKQ